MIRQSARILRPGLTAMANTHVSVLSKGTGSSSAAAPKITCPGTQASETRRKLHASMGSMEEITIPRRVEFTPNKRKEKGDVFLLTLDLSPRMYHYINQFQRERRDDGSHTLTHLTLFQGLPGHELPRMVEQMEKLCASTNGFDIGTARPFLRGRKKVAINIGPGLKEAISLQSQLKLQWALFLNEEDLRDWWPHWTLAQTADSREADELYEKLLRESFGVDGIARGLVLWKHLDGGRKEFRQKFWFKGVIHQNA